MHRGSAPAETKLTPESARRLGVLWRRRLVSGTSDTEQTPPPIVVGNSVYCGGWTLGRYGVSAGRLIWATSLDAFTSAPGYGQGLIIAVTPARGGYLYALDAASGEVVWGTPAPSRTNSQAIPTVAQGRVLVVSEERLTCYELQTGYVLWRRDVSGLGTGSASTPTVAGGLVCVNVGTSLFACHLDTGRLVWQRWFNRDEPLWGELSYTLPSDGRQLYAATRDGALRAVTLATGRTEWTSPTRFFGFHGVTAAPGLLVGAHFAGDRDVLMAFDAKTGTRRWSVRLPAYRFAGPPVVANGVVYVAELSSFVDTTVRAIRLRDGASLARVRSTGRRDRLGLPSPEDPSMSRCARNWSPLRRGPDRRRWTSTAQRHGGTDRTISPAGRRRRR